MSLPVPTTMFADLETCSSPSLVKGMSVRPVYCPDLVHSVSPVVLLDSRSRKSTNIECKANHVESGTLWVFQHLCPALQI